MMFVSFSCFHANFSRSLYILRTYTSSRHIHLVWGTLICTIASFWGNKLANEFLCSWLQLIKGSNPPKWFQVPISMSFFMTQKRSSKSGPYDFSDYDHSNKHFCAEFFFRVSCHHGSTFQYAFSPTTPGLLRHFHVFVRMHLIQSLIVMNLYRITDGVRRDMCTNMYGLEVRQPHVYMECILFAIFH